MFQASTYEKSRSCIQDLHFDETVKSHMEALPEDFLKDPDGSCLNLALLLSDQCPNILRMVRLDQDGSVLEQHRTHGNVLKQTEEAFQWMERNNPKRYRYSGLRRTEESVYPPEAVREVLINAVVHCDYSYPSPVCIRVYPERWEVISLGGSSSGLTDEEIHAGISVCRNPGLAAVFCHAGLMDGFGNGTERIRMAYREEESAPEYQVSEHIVKVILHRRAGTLEMVPEKETEVYTDPLQQCVLEYLEEHGSCGRQALEEYLETSSSTVVRLLRKLKNSGKIRAVGNGKNVLYSLVEENFENNDK